MIIVTVDTDLRQSFSIVVTVTVVILYIQAHRIFESRTQKV